MSTRDIKDRGFGWLCTAAAALAALIAVSAATPVTGQTRIPDDASAPSRSLVLSPTLQFTYEWDDNVFRVSKAATPTGDFVSTVSPTVQVSLRVPHLRVSGRSEVDFIHFMQLNQLRSIDTVNGAQVELLLWRLTPYVRGGWANTRHRRNFEIDLPLRRLDASWDAGVDLQLSGKTSIGVMTRRSRTDYEDETIYLDTDLTRYLGFTATINGVKGRYSLTPLTTVGADVEQDRNEFTVTGERNSEGFRVLSFVEFQPFALVSGSALIGVRRRTFVDGNAPPFQGMVGRVDLAYTLLGRTRLAVAGGRDLSYSYRADQRDYLQTGVQLSVTHRLANAWDVQGTLGRFTLFYGDSIGTRERVLSYGLNVGYRIERTRVGFQVARETRTSNVSVGRDYLGTRIASSVSYGF
jgi:Putative beta-barrel porin 2